jgi:predicted metal-dependent enzyme (double-stranded beta helix superfamily)
MSHHDQEFSAVPKKRVLSARPDAGLDQAERVELLVKGQGIVSFALTEKRTFSWTITDLGDTTRGLRLEIAAEAAVLYERISGQWQVIRQYKQDGVGLDPEKECQYWYSLDCHNRRIRYGKGEMRLKTMLVNYDFPPVPDHGDDPFAWVAGVESVTLAPPVEEEIVIWRDPVTTEPALFVVGTDKISMEDVARNNATVPANLTPACQMLYANVSGPNFQLNTPDFPDFVNAIEASIRNPQGWCYRKLKEKADEFGEHNEEETYLRITMGVNQGDSPGIPYVMEIWPGGHYSPIHNHGQANAVIRVLSGEIKVRLFAMLSMFHETPFAEQIFRKDDVTWISPGLNQFHQLINPNQGGPTCVTIQCYRYSDGDATHYEFFDYLSGDEIKPFTPNSDMGFLEFKTTMKREWETFGPAGHC